MNRQDILIALKMDLEIISSIQDEFLGALVEEAIGLIEQQGITLSFHTSAADAGLIRRYAAWLYRKRGSDGPMPVGLRRALNDRKFREVMKNA